MKTSPTKSPSKKPKRIRFAVVGQGHIAQVAVLPGFKGRRSAQLTALVSGDPAKLRKLGAKYQVPRVYSYEEYDQCLRSGEIDAVYISVPNHLHREYAMRAIEAGVHVLCEKPLAVSSRDAEALAFAAKKKGVKLMVAYRLHFDPANLKAIRLVRSGKIGEPRFFTSEFGFSVQKGNIRLAPEESGGPLHDIGIYCINAARYLFQAEPAVVFAFAGKPHPKAKKTYETVTAVMQFADHRLASFTCSFGSGGVSNYRVVGTKGDLLIENAYEYHGELTHTLTVGEKARRWTSKAGDQFAAEIAYFSDCILNDRHPEPSGLEGVADVKIIEALYRSIESGRPVKLGASRIRKRPSVLQGRKFPAHSKPQTFHVQTPGRET